MIQRSLPKTTQADEVSNRIVNRGFAPSTRGLKEVMRNLYNREMADNPLYNKWDCRGKKHKDNTNGFYLDTYPWHLTSCKSGDSLICLT